MTGSISRNGSCYELLGPADAAVVVLIHGLGLNRHVWRSWLPLLSERYRVLVYDLYGHGDSAAPPMKPSLSLFSEQLRDLLDQLAIDHSVLIGFSLGGMINRRLAMDHPARVGALIVLNSPHERGPEAQQLVEQRALDSAAGGPEATIDAAIERWFTPAFRSAHADYIEQVRAWVTANDPGIYAQCREVLAFGVLELIRPQPPITHATLVMTCEHDSGSTPAMSHAIAREISGAQVFVVPALQHMGLVEAPSLFVDAIVEFLEAQETPA
jgi:pimeloyl-ACP methyl ester carboxylesterase